MHTEFTSLPSVVQPGQIRERHDDGSRYRIERVTARFAVLVRLSDGQNLGRVSLRTVAATTRAVLDERQSDG